MLYSLYLQYYIKYHKSAQERCVTVKDYIDRILLLPSKYGTPFRVGVAEENNKIVVAVLHDLNFRTFYISLYKGHGVQTALLSHFFTILELLQKAPARNSTLGNGQKPSNSAYLRVRTFF